ncbi:MAG: 1,4-alpha-glucan branching enzyme, partial [Rhodocyclaceae bacterium]|nr:1,4-alpha-glucan branching enzyme [Rhodocyclaceae bacterium]
RKEGEWIPNEHGGRENIHAIQFLRQLNEAVYRDFPDTQTVAEESTAWPMVSRPTWIGGLGFGMKWNMGWMHDTLDYFAHEPVHRKFHHDQITFSIWYAFHENFMLPISHDEVVHGKGSLVGKLPGDEWQRFANLRLLLGYMWAHPGKKLLFMGSEFGQTREWNHDTSLDWHLLEFWPHAGAKAWLRDLNGVYKSRPALFGRDFSNDGFEWVDCHDSDESVISFLRRGPNGETMLVVLNATPVLREGYRVGVPHGGNWREVLNSDAPCYGGSGQGNAGVVGAQDWAHHGRPHSLLLRLPPLGVLFLEPAA